MDNLKKIGLTALGTALVASSASAADYSISATSQITLLGGEPGIGKSTLMLQIAVGLGSRIVLYVSCIF